MPRYDNYLYASTLGLIAFVVRDAVSVNRLSMFYSITEATVWGCSWLIEMTYSSRAGSFLLVCRPDQRYWCHTQTHIVNFETHSCERIAIMLRILSAWSTAREVYGTTLQNYLDNLPHPFAGCLAQLVCFTQASAHTHTHAQFTLWSDDDRKIASIIKLKINARSKSLYTSKLEIRKRKNAAYAI